MNFYLFRNVRFYVLLFSAILASTIFFYVKLTYPEETVQIIKYTQTFALITVSYLYIALLATPLTRFFPILPYRGMYIKARRSIGVSAFMFALLHAYYAFFGELGGFAGLSFLTSNYLIAISLSSTALLILTLMASTSFDFMIDKLGFTKWKIIHRLVYVAAIFTVIHALMLGSHYFDPTGLVYQSSFVAVAFLLILESVRFDKYLRDKITVLPEFGISFLIVAVGIVSYIVLSFASAAGVGGINIHAAHIQLAKDLQQQSNGPTSNIPGLQGDRTRRFTVGFNNPSNVQINQDTTLTFAINDASSGNKVTLFSNVYEKQMHLIIVDSSLTYFNHIHPTQTDNTFNITTQFPKAGQYHLYVDFQPLGAIEQQFAFVLNVGNVSNIEKPVNLPDTNMTKNFGRFQVQLSFNGPLKADQMTVGGQKLTFTIKDAATGNPVTNLKPYLAAFGHLVMINESTYDYIHVHPNNLIAPKPDENGGPVVEFLPIGIYGPIKPGIYRAFAQFNPNNELFTSDFTVNVQ